MEIRNYIKSKVIGNMGQTLDMLPFNSDSLKENLCGYVYEKFEKESKLPINSVNAFYYYKCIFVHIPKTAGLSINYSLFNSGGIGHPSIKDYQKLFGLALYEKYLKFSFVRNPWDRLVSAYFFLKKGGLHKYDQNFYETHLKQFETFDSFIQEWINPSNIKNYIHFREQSDFILDNNNRINLDFLGRYENISNDFEEIKSLLNINSGKINLKHLNTSSASTRNYKDFYNENTKKIVAKVYQQDIDIFKYSF